MIRWRATVHRWWVRYLLVALWSLPLLGALHQVVHGSATGLVPLLSSSSAASSAGRGGAEHQALHIAERSAHVAPLAAATWLSQMFGAHGSDTDCEVFDQLSHGQPLPCVPALDLPVQPVLSWLQLPHRTWLSAALVKAQARGPPLLV